MESIDQKYKILVNAANDIKFYLWPEDFAERLLAVKKDYPWMHEFIAHVERQGHVALVRSALSGQRARFYLKPISLTGLHGMGKSTVLISIMEALEIPFQVISMSGMADNMLFRGAPKGWSSARASLIVNHVAESGFMNPVLILDEIDKIPTGTHNGNALNSLLQMIEPSSACRLYDEYLSLSYDGSHITYLCTANQVDHIPDALRSRLQIIGAGQVEAGHVNSIVQSLVKKSMTNYLGLPTQAILKEDSGLRLNPEFVLDNNSEWVGWIQERLLNIASTKHPEYRRLSDVLINRNVRQAKKIVDSIIEFECTCKNMVDQHDTLSEDSVAKDKLH